MAALIALANSNCIATVDDGLTWEVISELPASSAGSYGAGFSGVYYAAGAVSAMRSDDAITWVEAAHHGLGGSFPILYNGFMLLAVDGLSGLARRSLDGGISWSGDIALPITCDTVGVIGTTFCLHKENGSQATSADGLTWSTGTTNGTFNGVYTTSFDRSRIIHASVPGSSFGLALTTNGADWSYGGIVGAGSDVGFNGVACSGDGSIVVIGSQSSKGTFRSTNGGASWSARVDTANFQPQSVGPVWVGSGATFVIPLLSGDICERTADGGATWASIPNPSNLRITGHQSTMFVLPEGIPGPPIDPQAFWTQRIRTLEAV